MSSPYYNETAQPQAPAPKQGKSWGFIIGGCAVVGILGALVCCGGFFFLGKFGLDAAAQNVAAQVQNEAAVQEHIGDITTSKFNFTRSGEEGGGAQVYSVEGSKGKGDVIVHETRGDQIGRATLVLPDGTRIPLRE